MDKQVVETAHWPGIAVENSWLTVDGVARLLCRSKSVVHKQWMSWSIYGVKPARYGARRRGRLMFKRSEIEAMIERWRIDDGAQATA